MENDVVIGNQYTIAKYSKKYSSQMFGGMKKGAYLCTAIQQDTKSPER